MENWSLDSHPILEKFRKIMDTLAITGANRFYYLFLTPPYAKPTVKQSALDYLFYSTEQDSNELTCCANNSLAIKIENKEIFSLRGFLEPFKIGISMTTFCTSVSGLSFSINELENDIYDLSRPVHPLYQKVLDCYEDSGKSVMFLEKTFDNVRKVRDLLHGIDNAIYKAEITPENKDDFVSKMSVSVDQLAAEVFSCPEVDVLPVGGRMKLNYLIFNAISSKIHFKLLIAFNEAYSTENSNAQKFISHHKANSKSKADKAKMQEAVGFLRNILLLKSPCAQISRVTQFFDAVVASLPGVDVAADDILPAICEAMTLDLSFASHVVSFFTYLAAIWPTQGLDERTNYILITCSIAASHLSVPQPEEKDPKVEEKEKIAEKTQNTIDMLEDLLSMI